MNKEYIKGFKQAFEIVTKEQDRLKLHEKISGDPNLYWKLQTVNKLAEALTEALAELEKMDEAPSSEA